jgi:integrase
LLKNVNLAPRPSAIGSAPKARRAGGSTAVGATPYPPASTSSLIRALLDGAEKLDRTARAGRSHIRRKAMLATLVFSGLRIGELCELRWRNVDLKDGWLSRSRQDPCRRSPRKDQARAACDPSGSTATEPERGSQRLRLSLGVRGRTERRHIRNRVLKAAVKRADGDLCARTLAPLPPRITPHSLRRTFVSILYALGEDPGVVMDEVGTTDPALALRVYRQSMRRGEREKADLRALVEAA